MNEAHWTMLKAMRASLQYDGAQWYCRWHYNSGPSIEDTPEKAIEAALQTCLMQVDFESARLKAAKKEAGE